jgi:hypothetical protein
MSQELFRTGAGNRARTDDLLITNQLLYQLSYAGETRRSKGLPSHNGRTEIGQSHRGLCEIPRLGIRPGSALSAIPM